MSNRPTLTPTISRTSAGSLELMDVFTCRDSVKFCKDSVEHGINVIAADYNSNGVYDYSYEISKYNRKPDDNILLVLGSEGEGINSKLAKVCQENVYIGKSTLDKELIFPYTLIDSLNVSVSSGVLLDRLTKGNR